MKIDSGKLRNDLKNYYGTAMFSGNKMAMMDLSRVEKASSQELIQIAQNNKIDMNKYILSDTRVSFESSLSDVSYTKDNVSISNQKIENKQNKKEKCISHNYEVEPMDKELKELTDKLEVLENDHEFFEKMHGISFDDITNKYKHLYLLAEIQTEFVENLQCDIENKKRGKKELVLLLESKKAELEETKSELEKIKPQYISEKKIIDKENAKFLSEKKHILSQIRSLKKNRKK